MTSFIGFLRDLVAISCLIFIQVAHAVPAVVLNEQDLEVNYFAVLGFDFNGNDLMSGKLNAFPNSQQVDRAYKEKMSQLQSRGTKGINFREAGTLARAKAILSDVTLRNQYLTKAAQNIQSKVRMVKPGEVQLPPGIDPKSLVGVIMVGDQVVGGVQASFNTAHLKYPVSLLRQRPEDNNALNFMKEDVDAPPPPSLLKSVDFSRLDPKWKNWKGGAAGLKLVRQEFERIIQMAPEMGSRYLNDEYEIQTAFLYWWFSREESLKQKSLAIEAMDRLDSIPKGSAIDAVTVMSASVSQPAWRTKGWIDKLLPRPKSFFALGPITGTDEVVSKADLVNAIIEITDLDNYGHLVYEYLLPRAESANHPEWAQKFLDSPSGSTKSFLNLFLNVLAHQPHWRQKHPEIITEALKRICKIQSGSRENYVYSLLTKPEALAHPEWLEILIKTDREDFLTLKLNHLLATDPWYNSAYLRKVLHGKPPTVEDLRRATWLRVVDVPQLAQKTSCKTIF